MTEKQKKRLAEAVSEAVFCKPENGYPNMETDSWKEDGYRYESVELLSTPANKEILKQLTNVCVNISSLDKMEVPDGSECRSLWLEACAETGTLHSETHLECGDWYTSSEFDDIHEMFDDSFAKEIFNTINQQTKKQYHARI